MRTLTLVVDVAFYGASWIWDSCGSGKFINGVRVRVLGEGDQHTVPDRITRDLAVTDISETGVLQKLIEQAERYEGTLEAECD